MYADLLNLNSQKFIEYIKNYQRFLLRKFKKSCGRVGGFENTKSLSSLPYWWAFDTCGVALKLEGEYRRAYPFRNNYKHACRKWRERRACYLVLFGATDKDRDETLTLILFPFYLCVSIPLSYFICEEEMCF
jgi:hypothetical protein